MSYKLLIGPTTNLINLKEYSNSYNLLQIFLGDPVKDDYKFIEENYRNMKFNKNILLFVHSKYIFNISKKNLNYAIKNESIFLKNNSCKNSAIIIHLSKNHKATKEEGLLDISIKLNELIKNYLLDTNIKLLIETSSNNNHLGSSIEDLSFILNNINPNYKSNIGICIDTSHLFLSGYPIDKVKYFLDYIAHFEMLVGLKYLSLIHLNDIDSQYFGKHTDHLPINNINGKIFKNKESIYFLLKIAKYFNIPIILERKNNDIKSINEEISFLHSIENNDLIKDKLNLIFFIKNIIILNLSNLLIDFYQTCNFNNEYTDKLTLIKKFKNKLIYSYDVYNSSNYNSNKIIVENNKLTYKLLLEDEYKYFKKMFENVLNNNDYSVFDIYKNDKNYILIKEFLKLKFFGKETIKKIIINDYDLESLLEIIKDKNILKKDKKKIFQKLSITKQQELILYNYKFLKENSIDEMIKIKNIILEKLKDFNAKIYGSIYRYENEIKEYEKIYLDEYNKAIPFTTNDIDLLLVIKDKNEFKTINNIILDTFLFKTYLINGELRKEYILKHSYKNKNIYFILDIYLCSPDEELFMKIFLIGPIEKNIKLYSIAKSKGYKLNQYGIYDLKTNKRLPIKNIKQLSQLLNIEI